MYKTMTVEIELDLAEGVDVAEAFNDLRQVMIINDDVATVLGRNGIQVMDMYVGDIYESD